MGRYTISDIAKLAGVSPATVSRVLSNSPGVNKEKRAEILEIIHKTNYHPSSVARCLVQGRSNVMGIIVYDLENQYYSSMVVSLQKYLREKGYMTMTFSVGAEDGAEAQRDYVREIGQQFDFAGLFISLPSSVGLVAESIRESRCPVVMMNRTFDALCDQVAQNDFQSGYLAATHLLELGHKDFLLFSGPVQDSISCQYRMEGFLQALATKGVELDQDNILPCPLEMDAARRLALQVLGNRMSGQNKPSAAFVNGNTIALGVLWACDELGIKVPGELSLMTVDNPKILSMPCIDLTTVSCEMDQMIRAAVDLLLDRLETGRKKNRFISLQPELIVRGSTAAPKLY